MARIHRRVFLQQSAAIGAALAAGPLRAQGVNERLNMGFIGVGGRGNELLEHFGRLRDVAPMEDAQAQLAAIGAQHAAAHPETHKRLSPRVMPYAYPILDIQGITLAEVAGMQAIVSILLVVVAVNIAVLVYARTATRDGEIAIGYKIKMLESDPAANYGVKINPAKDAVVTLDREDCLVVVAEDDC